MLKVHLGVIGPNTYSSRNCFYTDAQGRSSLLTWNAGRGLWEDAAGGRTLNASSASLVTSKLGTISVPALAPVDVVSRGAVMLGQDGGAPRGWALYLDNSQPN